ncbi:MAG: aminopeptidase P N-terminal domain-containing protein [Longimicrobiales bacterium]
MTDITERPTGLRSPHTPARRWRRGLMGGALVGLCLAAAPPAPQPQLPISVEEYRARRDRLMTALDGGITLLHAQPTEKAMEQWGFVQDPSFLYFTGLSDLTGAILALDAPAEEVRLFLPPAPESFGFAVEGLVPSPGQATAEELAVTSAESWDGFASWLDGRLEGGVTTLYVDEPRRPEAAGVPPGMAATAGPRQLWRASLEGRFPTARFESAKEAIHALRWVKSHAEIDALRANAEATVHALREAARQMSPGMRQREGESRVVSACIEAGAQGPSFWPWLMSGPNARVGRLVQAFFRYDQLDRIMNAGELVRVDIGCAGDLYGADVGRTLPVSGAFSEGQREAWDLLIEGYLAGIQVMADGVTVDSVRAASVDAIRVATPGLTTPMGRSASEAILSGGSGVWHIHGVGIESGEDAAPVLRAGAVVAYEPGFELGPDAFYLEDMIVITDDGAEILSVGLPHDASGIEAMMAQR